LTIKSLLFSNNIATLLYKLISRPDSISKPYNYNFRHKIHLSLQESKVSCAYGKLTTLSLKPVGPKLSKISFLTAQFHIMVKASAARTNKSGDKRISIP